MKKSKYLVVLKWVSIALCVWIIMFLTYLNGSMLNFLPFIIALFSIIKGSEDNIKQQDMKDIFCKGLKFTTFVYTSLWLLRQETTFIRIMTTILCIIIYFSSWKYVKKWH